MVLRVKHNAENSTQEGQQEDQCSSLSSLWNGFRVTPTNPPELTAAATTDNNHEQLGLLFKKLEKLNNELSSVVLKGQSNTNYTCLLEELNQLVTRSDHHEKNSYKSPPIDETTLVKNDLVANIVRNKTTKINVTQQHQEQTPAPAVDEEPPKNVIYLSKSAQWLRHNPERWDTGLATTGQHPTSKAATLESYPPSVASALQKMRIHIQNFESSKQPSNVDIGAQLAELTQQILTSGKCDLSTEKDITLNLLG